MKRLVAASLAAAVAALFALPASAQQPIVIKLASPAPVRSYLHSDIFQPWADEVTKASEGTLKVETVYGGQLGNFGVMYDRTVDGVADIGFIVASFSAGK